jgi:hypothetical protein
MSCDPIDSFRSEQNGLFRCQHVDCEFQLVVEQGAVFHPGVAARDDFFSDRVRCSGDVRFGSKAEVFAGSKEVRFVPQADMRHVSTCDAPGAAKAGEKRRQDDQAPPIAHR